MWRDGNEEKTVAGAGRRYVVDTTVSGVRRAVRPGLVARVLWVGAIVTATGMLVFSIQALVTARDARQLGTATRLDDSRAQSFPAVTVCHVNAHVTPVTTTTTSTTTTSTTTTTTSTTTMSTTTPFVTTGAQTPPPPIAAARKKRLALDKSSADRLAYQTLVDSVSESELIDYGHSLKSILLGCRLGDYYCDDGNFTHFYDHVLGNCYTFTTTPADLQTYKTGPNHGLTLELASNTNRTMPSEEWGFVVMAHRPRDTIFVAEEGVYVPTGRAAYLAVTKAMSAEPPNSDCVDTADAGTNQNSDIFTLNTGWRYSRRGCQRTCLQRSLVTECGCCDISLPCPARLQDVTSTSLVAAPRCDLSDTTQAACVKNTAQKYSDGDLNCVSECKPQCRATRYPARLSLTTWAGRTYGATTSYETRAQDTKLQSNSVANQEAEQMDSPVTAQPAPTPQPVTEGSGLDALRLEQFQDSRALNRKKRQLTVTSSYADAKIHVYFEDLRVRVSEPVVYDEWVELMADIGGVASLWLGLSVLGVLELLHMFVEWALLAFAKCCKGQGRSVTPVKPFDGSA